jgi:hypothetical protein
MKIEIRKVENVLFDALLTMKNSGTQGGKRLFNTSLTMGNSNIQVEKADFSTSLAMR